MEDLGAGTEVGKSTERAPQSRE